MNKTQTYMQEDEIDLRELLNTIYKYKTTIISITLIITAVATAYAYMLKPIYEVKTNIQVGYIGENLLDEPKNIQKIVSVVFDVEDKRKSENSTSEITSVSVNKNATNFIEIKAEGISNDEALKKSKEVLNYLRGMHENKIEQYLFTTKNKIQNNNKAIEQIENYETQSIKQEIERIKSQQIAQIDESIAILLNTELPAIEEKLTNYLEKISEYNKEIQKLNKATNGSSNETSMMISSIQMLNYQTMILNAFNETEDLKIKKERILKENIPTLKREKDNLSNETIRDLQYKIDVELKKKKSELLNEIELLKLYLTPNYIKNHELVGDYYISEHPIKPKKKLIITVAFVSGLILSIFLIFMIDFFKAPRDDKSRVA